MSEIFGSCWKFDEFSFLPLNKKGTYWNTLNLNFLLKIYYNLELFVKFENLLIRRKQY